jgi:ABC-2 type transport system ATP-binding protein|tara:strand:+ start:1341 stop:2279 length:939 start_codon:yes stop_codon:yes gene_type:complete
MIEVSKLSKSYGDFLAVDALSFQVDKGEVLGFLGPNGAGKTTSMRMLAGFVTPTAGDAYIYGHSICDDSLAARRIMGYLPEGAPLYGDMTPLTFLRFIADTRNILKHEQAAAIGSVVDTLQLGSVLQQPIDTLSKGYRRRLGLAQAIIHNPKVLILDEPTDGLDPNQKHELRELISAMSADRIILISSHILEEVEAVCSRAIIIAQGRILIDSTPQALVKMSRWHNAVTLRFPPNTLSDQELKARAAIIAGIANVERAESNTAEQGITAFPKHGAAIIHDINQLAAALKWQPEECRVETGKLDDVFRTITIQ